ncbi:phage tail tip lysozyme [Nocardia carnea]|uniref:phage tail tip lysozyme n=1 Tax=Nocardia carnea TaxID=37328 RepID=UPI002454F455|nr:phage tail tip lysozyme [Nocardia carnea]
MSPPDPKKIGDLETLPGCAPKALQALFDAAEEVIQRQVQLLGKGTPSKAPDLRQELRQEGIANPDHQSTMLTNYGNSQAKVDNVTNEFRTQDGEIPEHTATVGGAVGDAYSAIETAVGDLNDTIAEAHKPENIVVVKNDKGEVTSRHLTDKMLKDLFNGLWVAVDKTYDEVSNVSDQAAEQARKIAGGETSFNRSPYNGTPPPVIPTVSGPSGTPTASVTPTSGLMSPPTPSGNAPDPLEVMKYLIEEHGFTPAQAAGIAANVAYESSFNVGATGDNGTAHGLFQWRFDRYAGLQEFASRPGENINSWETHIDYMVHELRSGSSYQAAENAVYGNPNQADVVASKFDELYERSSGATTAARANHALTLLNDWNSPSNQWKNSESNIAI